MDGLHVRYKVQDLTGKFLKEVVSSLGAGSLDTGHLVLALGNLLLESLLFGPPGLRSLGPGLCATCELQPTLSVVGPYQGQT